VYSWRSLLWVDAVLDVVQVLRVFDVKHYSQFQVVRSVCPVTGVKCVLVMGREALQVVEHDLQV
jgi:hypothetical protein